MRFSQGGLRGSLFIKASPRNARVAHLPGIFPSYFSKILVCSSATACGITARTRRAFEFSAIMSVFCSCSCFWCDRACLIRQAFQACLISARQARDGIPPLPKLPKLPTFPKLPKLPTFRTSARNARERKTRHRQTVSVDGGDVLDRLAVEPRDGVEEAVVLAQRERTIAAADVAGLDRKAAVTAEQQRNYANITGSTTTAPLTAGITRRGVAEQHPLREPEAHFLDRLRPVSSCSRTAA